MSWLFSQALVAEFSEAICSDGEPSPPSNGTPTPQAFSSPDRTMAFSRLSRFGMTCAPLTDGRGADLLTSYRAGFPARTSAPQEAAKALKERARASGGKWLESWARFDRATSSWRTVQFSLLEDWGSFLGTWPRSGLMRHGACYPLATLAHGMRGNESGSLPTLLASNTKAVHLRSGGRPPRSYLPTLTVCGNYNRKGSSATSGDGLNTRLRTLCASDADKWSRQTVEERIAKGQQVRINHQLGGGPLNPTWCEWFMGFPQEWPVLKPLGTPRFREWQQQHSLNSARPWSNAA